MKSFLVTGGSGLVGKGIESVLVPESDEKWTFVGSKDADLLDESEVRRLFLKVCPTHVIHLAAEVGGLYKNLHNNLSMFKKNCRINDNVLSACYDFQIQKCISCLSTCIFPDQIELPLVESKLHLGPPHDSNFGYAYAKRNLDILNRCYNNCKNDSSTLFTSVIPCNIFGPNDNFNQFSAHVIPSMISRAVQCKADNNDFTIYGSGNALRQFIYSKDIGRLIISLARSYEDTEPIILSPDENHEISISQVAQVICSAADFEGSIVYDTAYTDGQYRKTCSNEKLRQFCPDFEFTPFPVAIKETVDWFKLNKLEARL